MDTSYVIKFVANMTSFLVVQLDTSCVSSEVIDGRDKEINARLWPTLWQMTLFLSPSHSPSARLLSFQAHTVVRLITVGCDTVYWTYSQQTLFDLEI